MDEAPPPSRLQIAIHIAAAAIVGCIVVVVYVGSMSRGNMPPGHPWSGFALGAIAFNNGFAAWRLSSGSRTSGALGVIAPLIAMVGAFMWLASVIARG